MKFSLVLENMILPSLLEYSIEKLEFKINLLKKHKIPISRFQSQKNIAIHLDFVLPQFAKDRAIMCSLGLKSVFDLLLSHYNEEKIDLSIHLMGTLEDLSEAYKFFETYEFKTEWNFLILVPEKYTESWNTNIKKTTKNLRIGVWYDLDQWQKKVFEKRTTNLLMTVLAGKSGQKLETTTKELVESLVKSYPDSRFIVDGGWQVDDKVYINTDVVSYSSFWKSLESK
jgi:pentose-5-phosphate-3-epimerase